MSAVPDSPPEPPSGGSFRLRAAIIEFGALAALFTALTALLFWQFLPQMSSALLGPPEDNMQDFWNSWYAVQPHPDGFFFTRMIRWPEGTALHYHSFAYPQVFAVWILAKLFGQQLSTLVLLQNITLLASFPIAGIGAFYLCRYLTRSEVGGLAGGVLFAFNPSHVIQAMHHTHVANIQFLPFFLVCYLIALDRKSYYWLGGTVVFYALSALSCWYYLFYILYFIGFHLLYLRIRDHAWPRGWNLLAPVLVCAATVLLLSPLLLPMLGGGLQNRAYLNGTNTFVADLLAYFAFPSTHIFADLGAGIYDRLTGNIWEDTVYLGLINLAVLGFVFWKARNGDRRLFYYALGGMLFFCVIASGDALHIGGWVSPLKMPAIILGKLPFFGNVRTPGRAIVFVYLFLSVIVALAAAMLLRGRRTPALYAGMALVAGLMLLDFMPARLEFAPVTCPTRALAPIMADPDRDFGILDLPYDYAEENYDMLLQACHGRPIAMGVVSRQIGLSLVDRLEVRDLAAQKRQLTEGKIKYILLHKPDGALFHWTRKWNGPEEKYRQTYPVVHEAEGLTVLRVY